MRAMSKDRDIDDILESLNQLLREGESHNDDHVESVEDPKSVKQKLSDLEDELSEVESIDALLSATPEVTDSDPDSNDGIEDDISDKESEAETAESSDQDESDEDESDEGESEEIESDEDLSEENEPEAENMSDDDDKRLSTHRVVLTEEMLVDNPQRSLLSLVGNSVDHDDEQVDEVVEPEEPSESQTETSVDHALMAELLDRIADDVIQQLPILIKASLEQHLNDLIQDDQSSDLPDQPEE